MPRNYDTTAHKPYPRITRIEIDYDASGVPRVQYVERMAVVDGDGVVRHLDDTPRSVDLPIDMAQANAPIALVQPDTGAPIPGQAITLQVLMLGMLAVIRADQVQRDTLEDAAQAAAPRP